MPRAVSERMCGRWSSRRAEVAANGRKCSAAAGVGMQSVAEICMLHVCGRAAVRSASLQRAIEIQIVFAAKAVLKRVIGGEFRKGMPRPIPRRASPVTSKESRFLTPPQAHLQNPSHALVHPPKSPLNKPAASPTRPNHRVRLPAPPTLPFRPLQERVPTACILLHPRSSPARRECLAPLQYLRAHTPPP